MEFTEIIVLVAVATACLLSAYNSNVMVMFQKKGITTIATKNSIKNVRIHDARAGITYVYLSRQWVKEKIYLCEVYPVSEKRHQVTIKFNFSWLRSNVLEPLDRGTITLEYVRPEDFNSTYAVDNSLFEDAPHILYDKLARYEKDNIRMKAEITELRSLGHQHVKKVLDEVGSLKRAEGQGKGGFTK